MPSSTASGVRAGSRRATRAGQGGEAVHQHAGPPRAGRRRARRGAGRGGGRAGCPARSGLRGGPATRPGSGARRGRTRGAAPSASRVGSNTVGLGDAGRVPVGGEQAGDDDLARRDHGVADPHGRARPAERRHLHRAVEAQQLLDRGREASGSACSSARLSGWVRRVYIPLPMRLTVVSWPATSSRNTMDVSSSSVSRSAPSRAATSADIRSSAGCARLVRHELAHVGDQRRRRADPRVRADRGAADERRRPAPEPGLVPGGHPEQLADHGDRQRVGVRRDQVGFAVLGERGGEVVEEAVGDLLDPWGERVDPAAGERPGDQPPQPGVVGRVVVQEVAVHRDVDVGRQQAARGASGRGS